MTEVRGFLGPLPPLPEAWEQKDGGFLGSELAQVQGSNPEVAVGRGASASEERSEFGVARQDRARGQRFALGEGSCLCQGGRLSQVTNPKSGPVPQKEGS